MVVDQPTTPTLLLDTTSRAPGYPAGASTFNPPLPLPYGQIVLFFGIFTDGGTFESSSTPFGIRSQDSAQPLTTTAGSSDGLVFTPGPGYLAFPTSANDQDASAAGSSGTEIPVG